MSCVAIRLEWKYLFLPCALFCVAACSSDAHAASAADWRRDIDEIVVSIRGIHPDPFARAGRIEFLRRAEALKADLHQLNEEQRVTRAMKLVAMLGDTHTQLEPNRPDFALWYPIRIVEFTDGFFVTAAHRSVAELAGAQLLEVSGVPVARAVDQARDLMGADNSAARKERLFAFSNAALMRGLGIAQADGRLEIKSRLASGKVVGHTLIPSRTDDLRYAKDDSTFDWHQQAEMGGPPFGGVGAWISAYKGLSYEAFRTTDTARPLRFMNRRGFASKSLPGQSAYYLQANYMDEKLPGQIRQALAEVDQLRPRRLILDFRYNFGGDGSHVPSIVREFVKRESVKSWQELYILTGPRTFSAGIMAVVALAANTVNTIVGEPMSAPINSFGDARTLQLPRTGLQLTVSTVLNQLGTTTDLHAFAAVDVPAPMSFSDYASGRDPAVDAILRGDEMRSLPVIALTDGGPAARRAWSQRRDAFSKAVWWLPPPEIELRRAMQILADQARKGDAIEVAILNAEIHPGVWNVWYNLARAQMEAGQVQDALMNFRRVLELDPDNGNADEIRREFARAGVAMQ
ncbi:MAG: hypothetical protein JNJ55_11400 [Betaproteobacteria bacterium]|nr:hypothetical protein [Betaproteobacteria bacterium]